MTDKLREAAQWHHPECEGDCIACLIEREVKDAYGNQGLSYLLRHVTASSQREWQGLTDEEIREFEIWLDDEEEKRGWNPPADIVKYIEAKLRRKIHDKR